MSRFGQLNFFKIFFSVNRFTKDEFCEGLVVFLNQFGILPNADKITSKEDYDKFIEKNVTESLFLCNDLEVKWGRVVESSAVEEISGGDQWRRSVEEISGGDQWRRSVEEISGGDQWRRVEWSSKLVYFFQT
jgi:hypothetical protein